MLVSMCHLHWLSRISNKNYDRKLAKKTSATAAKRRQRNWLRHKLDRSDDRFVKQALQGHRNVAEEKATRDQGCGVGVVPGVSLVKKCDWLVKNMTDWRLEVDSKKLNDWLTTCHNMTGGGGVWRLQPAQASFTALPRPSSWIWGMWRGKGRKGGERRRKEVKGEEVGKKERGWKKKGRGNGRGSEGRDGTPLFGTK